MVLLKRSLTSQQRERHQSSSDVWRRLPLPESLCNVTGWDLFVLQVGPFILVSITSFKDTADQEFGGAAFSPLSITSADLFRQCWVELL